MPMSNAMVCRWRACDSFDGPVLMAKFEVYRIKGGTGYVLDCPADLLSDLRSRFVVPLLAMEEAPKPAMRLNPVFEIEGRAHVMATQFAAAIPVSELGQKVASLAAHDIVVGNALDMLICGF